MESEGLKTMTRYSITNNDITAVIDTMGAELKSLRRTSSEREYIWNGDPTLWKRSSPLLFPIVGTVGGDKYRHDGMEYQLIRHGFARDMEFEIREQSDSEITMSLTASDSTRAVYPFEFELLVHYSLDGSTLKTNWTVRNLDSKTMYFSIGAHPAFNCNFQGLQGELDFGNTSSLKYHPIDAAGLYLDEEKTMDLDSGKLLLGDDLFAQDALIVEGGQAHSVGLLEDGKEYLRIDFDADIFGLWSPAKMSAPFVCVEPWYGRCDSVGFTGELRDKPYIQSIEVAESWSRSYGITIL
jgi:galactose mutarotase-like enzyme